VVSRVRVIGAGRAGGSFAIALRRAGWAVELWDRDHDVEAASHGVDLVLIATPDADIAGVAALIEPDASCVIAHVSGASPLSVLAPHEHRASIHPLMTLPDPTTGAAALAGAWFAVSGDPASLGLAKAVVAAVGGRPFVIDDDHRAAYHAAACVASNHVVALLGQVERIANAAGVPFAAFEPLVQASVANAFALGPLAALTGPASRGDWGTIARHLVALDALSPHALSPSDRDDYRHGVRAARRLAVGHDDTPAGLGDPLVGSGDPLAGLGETLAGPGAGDANVGDGWPFAGRG
jgi:predicted short-subunit dehydrogenase-like oxidoreductase (DUF2520 family)